MTRDNPVIGERGGARLGGREGSGSGGQTAGPIVPETDKPMFCFQSVREESESFALIAGHGFISAVIVSSPDFFLRN